MTLTLEWAGETNVFRERLADGVRRQVVRRWTLYLGKKPKPPEPPADRKDSVPCAESHRS